MDRYLRPFRGFEDGRKVFLHSYQSFGRGQVSQVLIDVFDTDDDDHITARWNVTVPVVSPTRTGRGQIDGPTQVSGLEHTDANRNLVRRYIADVLIDGRGDRVDAYLDPDGYAEHSPDIADGSRGFRHHLDSHAARGMPVRYDEPILVVGCGNYTATLCNATIGTQPHRVFDLYRLGGGRIVEHWDAATAL